MMEKRKLGRVAHASSVVTLGAAGLGREGWMFDKLPYKIVLFIFRPDFLG